MNVSTVFGYCSLTHTADGFDETDAADTARCYGNMMQPLLAVSCAHRHTDVTFKHPLQTVTHLSDYVTTSTYRPTDVTTECNVLVAGSFRYGLVITCVHGPVCLCGPVRGMEVSHIYVNEPGPWLPGRA